VRLRHWSPAVDVREYSDRFQLLLDVPGVEPKDVEITLDHGVLSVSGNRTGENSAPGAKSGELAQHQRNERPLGRFHRRFILPDTADAEHAQASGRHGVLEIVIPKQPKAQPRRIAVTDEPRATDRSLVLARLRSVISTLPQWLGSSGGPKRSAADVKTAAGDRHTSRSRNHAPPEMHVP
jgi:HSP20 family protein